LEVRDATFEWEETLSAKEAKEARAKNKKGKSKEKEPAGKATRDHVTDDQPFQARNIDMLVPRGSLVAIVGAVGSGKVCFELDFRDKYAETDDYGIFHS
jgi:ATP-binding cassette, subfamily C (CFTR/MRP), member 1